MKITWPYIAGFFDGEGSQGCVRRKSNPMGSWYANIAQSGEEGRTVLNEIAEFLAEQGIKCSVYDYGIKNRSAHINSTRPMYNLSIQNRRGIHLFLGGMLPYLRVKKVKAQDILRYFTLYPSLQGRVSNKLDLCLDDLKLDREAGLTYDQIAEKYEVSTMAVWDRLNPQRAHRLRYHEVN